MINFLNIRLYGAAMRPQETIKLIFSFFNTPSQKIAEIKVLNK